jgi:glucose/arabinose dehydrogenase
MQEMKLRLSVVTFILCLSLLSMRAQVDVDIQLVEWATGLTKPVDLTHAGDERMFYINKDGIIGVLQPDGSLNATPFLDISSLTDNSGLNSEQGLLGLAFHPDYQNNGYFYVNYTRLNGDTRVARYTVSADPDIADASTALEILTIDQPFGNHNGGCLKFGPDGYLYIGTGDGGSGEDPLNNGQSMDELLGKMLRLDVDAAIPYSVPVDNPYVGTSSDTLPEIWAAGLRNPWRYSFDRMTGDLWIGDVGQYTWEEVDFQPASSQGGENYGWRCYEGNHTGFGGGCPPMSSFDGPVAEYNHNSGRCSITGGFVYRGQEFPALDGKYFFTDYCNGQFWSLEQNDADEWVQFDVLGAQGFGWVTFGEDVNGTLYMVNQSQGKVYKILDANCPTTEASIEQVGNVLTATEGSTYQWYQDGQMIDGATDQTYVVLEEGSYAVFVTFNNFCGDFSVPLSVGVNSLEENVVIPTTVMQNPIGQSLELRIGNEFKRSVVLTVIDITGRVITRKTVNPTVGLMVELESFSWASGKYVVNLESQEGKISLDVMKL